MSPTPRARLAALTLSPVFLLAGAIAGTQPAAAGNCILGLICGDIRNSPTSSVAINVFDVLGPGDVCPSLSSPHRARVAPGHSGPAKDDDAFKVGKAGYFTTSRDETYIRHSFKANQCVKISDGQTVQVFV